MSNLPIEIKESGNLPNVFEAANLEALFKQVEEQVKGEIFDVETQEGRAHIKSVAAKISSSKTAIDKPIRDYLREIKELPKIIEKNARESIARFDALRDETLAPLAAAQAEQDKLLEWMNGIPVWCMSCQQSELAKQVISDLEGVLLDSFWPDLRKKAKTAHEAALTVVTNTLNNLLAAEKQAAELEALQAEKARLEQAAHDARVAKEAEERARAEQQRQIVEAQQREEQARRDKEAAEARAIEAEAKAKRDAELAAERAAQAERERMEAEEAEAKRLADARAADKENRIKINRAALVALIAEGLSEDDAKKVVTAIAKGLVPNVKIFY